MPRANFAAHSSQHARWDAELLSLPAACDVVTKLRELGRERGEISLKDAARLTLANHKHLETLIRRKELTRAEGSALNLTTDSAISLVSLFLPRILGWKTVSSIGDELGVHRNSVESMVRLHGKPEMLRLCRDNYLYISPEGEALVRERKRALDQAERLEPLSDFTKRIGVPLNHLTAFFSSRSSPFTLDIHGRARISEEQKQTYLLHRAHLERRKRHDDILRDGKPYRSVARLATEQASLFSRPGTAEHKTIAFQTFSAMRYFAESSGVAHKTDIGLYVPAQFATAVSDAISLTDASRILGVTKNTIAGWRRRDRSIAPPASPRIRQRGVCLSALVEVAHKQFRDDPGLSQLDTIPTFLLSFGIHRVAKRLGTSFSNVVEVLPISSTEQEALENRVGAIPRATHQLVTAILHPKPDQKITPTLSKNTLDTLQSNAERLGLSPSEFLDLAVTPKIVARCVPEQLPLKIPASRYNVLLRLGLITPTAFANERIVPATTVVELLKDWRERNKVHIKTALSIINLTGDEESGLMQSRGEVSGTTILKVLSLTRMSGDSARQKYPTQFVNGPRYEEPSARGNAFLQWGKNLAEAPAVRTIEELVSLLNGKDSEAPDLKDGCLSPALVADLITRVAQARAIHPEKVYGFARELLRTISPWPATYGEFTRIVREGLIPIRFATVVGKCLLEVSDPKTVVYPYKQTLKKPTVGDLFVHSSMQDYGKILRLEEGDGGTLVVVDLVLSQRRLSFRV